MFQRSLLTDTDIGPLADGVLTTLEDADEAKLAGMRSVVERARAELL